MKHVNNLFMCQKQLKGKTKHYKTELKRIKNFISFTHSDCNSSTSISKKNNVSYIKMYKVNK